LVIVGGDLKVFFLVFSLCNTRNSQQQQQQQQKGPKECPFDLNSSSCICSKNGTSLSLLRRLIIQQTQYGSSLLTLEGGLTCTDSKNNSTLISPIGKIQQAVQSYVAKNDIGTHLTNVAILLDFYQGFTPPRHLYSPSLYVFLLSTSTHSHSLTHSLPSPRYRAWGNHLWDEGDFASHGVFNLIYPEYEKASYYHDETGFLTGTPFNDATDVLLSDAPLWLLNRYSLIVMFTGVRGLRDELRFKLEGYVKQGGTLVVNSKTICEVSVFGMGGEDLVTNGVIEKGTKIEILGQSVVENVPVQFAKTIPGLPDDAVILARTASSNENLVYSLTRDKGRVIVLSSSGVSSESQVNGTIKSDIDTPLPNPFPLASHVENILTNLLRDQRMFYFDDDDDEDKNLSIITNRVKNSEYIVAVSNNVMNQKHIKSLSSSIGTIKSVEEIILSDAHLFSSKFPGYVPTHTPSNVSLGNSTSTSIAGLDQRLFRVVLSDESDVDWISDSIDPVPKRTRMLSLSFLFYSPTSCSHKQVQLISAYPHPHHSPPS